MGAAWHGEGDNDYDDDNKKNNISDRSLSSAPPEPATWADNNYGGSVNGEKVVRLIGHNGAAMSDEDEPPPQPHLMSTNKGDKLLAAASRNAGFMHNEDQNDFGEVMNDGFAADEDYSENNGDGGDSTQSPLLQLMVGHRTPDHLPFFDPGTLQNVTALVGKSAYLNCRVRNLGNKTVSLSVKIEVGWRVIKIGSSVN